MENLPMEVSEIDALRLENLKLKLQAAERALNEAGAVYNAAVLDAAARYQFDPEKDAVIFATRQIERK